MTAAVSRLDIPAFVLANGLAKAKDARHANVAE